MKKAISLALCLVMAGAALSACSDPDKFSDSENLTSKFTRSDKTDETFNYADGADTAPSSYETYQTKITDFELRLFRNCHKNGSYVICPANEMLNLADTANGALGDTQSEILNALGSGLTLENVNQCSSYFASRLQSVADSESSPSSDTTEKKTDGKYFVKLLNSQLVNDKADMMTGFLQTTKNYYDTNVLRFDFADSSSLKKLNNFYSDFSNGSSASQCLDKNQSFVSLSAADICDKWLNPYAKTDITKGKFKSSDGEKEVNYMTSNETYMKSKKAKAVMKYFSQTPLKMMLIMPEENVSLDDYVSDFTMLEYTTLLDSVDVTKNVETKIPEFSISAEKSPVDMTKAMQKSGLKSTFTDDANYKNLSHSDKTLYSAAYELSPALTINAGGIAGTVSNGDEAELEKHTQKTEKCDTKLEFNRPFMFIILDNESSIPVYMGAYTGA